MANIILPAGGGGGQVILRAEGQQGNHVKAKLGSKLVEGDIPEGGVLQLKLPGLGLWEVDTEAEDSMYHFQQEVKVYRYGITPCWALAKKAFFDCTPGEIQFVSRARLAKDFWQIGDRHLIDLKTEEKIYMRIADFDHDYATDGATKLPLTLVMEDCLLTKQIMGNGQVNTGGWKNSIFRINTMPTLLANFPDEWRSIITTCQKKTSAGNGSSVIDATEDDIWLLSEIEIDGTPDHSYLGEGVGYPIFTDNTSRIKRLGSTGSGATKWWTRSPCQGGNLFWVFVETDGSVQAGNTNYPNAPTGIALGFCVG